MKNFAHISDLHLGYTSGKKVDNKTKINLREQDGYQLFNECIDEIINEGDIDFVICTGDFFHSPKPNMRAILEAQTALRKLAEHNIKFYCLAGNHDSTDTVKDIPANRVLHIPELGIYSYSDPYKVIEIDNVALHLVSHHGYTLQHNTMEQIKLIENKINILCTHGSCFDDNLGIILHSEAEPREIVIPQKILDMDWDYILLGHIHERGWVGSTDGRTDTSDRKVFYGGSLLRRGFSDKECKLGRGWTKWSINEKTKEFTPKFFTLNQRRQMEIVINCLDKEVSDIENELQEIFTNLELDDFPILRVILIDIQNNKRTQINWKRFEEFTSKCLTFHIKFTTAQEFNKMNISGEIFSFDLLESYKEYWEQANTKYKEEYRKEINSINNKLLRRGQDKILESTK